MRENQHIKLIGNRVLLVPYEACHVPKYHEWMGDAELRRLTASERLSLDEEYEMQKSWRSDRDKCTFIILSRQLLDNNNDEVSAMIGDVNIFIMDGISELEVMIAEKQWRGQGCGREAVRLMIKYGTEHLNLQEFQVKIGENNAPSLAVFENLGFSKRSYSSAFREYTLQIDQAMLNDIVSDQTMSIEPYKQQH